ncbi:hypothetical protein chiPu_0013384 [Chiloscyllium punctatum]|uniref:Uncharacterized protein n=1 Tax=Chiloscyllium punctatum TaxID=137246 RepID=A0A401SWX5_CHIPU|nr:hypothetical protein [Chiloscyllium punctatum]
MELYHTTEPFVPEGVLGTIDSILIAFIRLQDGKIVLVYRPNNLSILKLFLIWTVLLVPDVNGEFAINNLPPS